MDKIGQLKGKVVAMRVLPFEFGVPRTEMTVQATGKLHGMETRQTVTFWSVARPDGTLYGEGHGIDVLADGQAVPFRGAGVGKPTGVGLAAAWRGVLFYEPNATKLASMSEAPVLVDFRTDEQGNAEASVFQFK